MISWRRSIVATLLCATLCASGCSSPTSPSTSAIVLADQIGGLWTLVTQQPAGQSEDPPPAGSMFRIEIAADRAAITADCNRCNGAVAVGEHTVTIGPLLACTRVFCASAPFDHAFLQLLADESQATIAGETLLLQSHRGVMRFRR